VQFKNWGFKLFPDFSPHAPLSAHSPSGLTLKINIFSGFSSIPFAYIACSNMNSQSIEGYQEDAMADNKSNRGNPDRLRISLSEDWEVNYWANELGISREKLIELVRTHGDSALNIRQAIREQASKERAS
jgi:hypothetical protein